MRRRPFKKGYFGNWSEELFVVGTRLSTLPVTYMLKDLAFNDIKETFSTPTSLSSSRNSDEALFDVERIAKTRKRAFTTKNSPVDMISRIHANLFFQSR